MPRTPRTPRTPRRSTPVEEHPVTTENATVEPTRPVLNFEEVTITVDQGILHDCDHTTFVAKMFGPADEAGERPEILLGRICAKKKTWWFTELKHIFINENYRRMGVAKHMVNFIINDAIFPDADRKMVITATIGGIVNVDNVETQQMLASLGFVLAVSFRNRETGNDLMLMIKSLSPVPSA
jgi:hypothetical protein